MILSMASVPNDDEEILKQLRKRILEVACTSSEGHVPSALSILDILYCLYVKLPTLSSLNVTTTDSFILSKGHAAIGFYAILERAGLISPSWAHDFAKFDSDFGGHPDVCKVKEVNASTGSLGHGLSLAVGKIIAKRLTNSNFRIYCLLGDGELNEGSNWEGLLLASHHKLKELTVIIDYNESTDRALSLGHLENKLKSFGFRVLPVNGHSHLELCAALMERSGDQPLAILANTVKGFGVPVMVNNPMWHHKSPNSEELKRILGDIQ